ncbi:MAG: hypothetical protein KGL39_37880 [Patescibacteria group bacterium]|nr:hypothetical protein [Patescibacteria group bacterium]
MEDTELKESVGEIVRKMESLFINGNTQISKYVNFSMHDTLEKIEAYANSKHVSGEYDSLGREKPFFNIVTAAINIWYRATDLDRKNIKFVPATNKSIVLAFVANVILQNWMRDERWGVFLNDWGRALSKYGSSVTKFVKKGDALTSSVIPWNRLICDAVDFDANPQIEILELTEAQLRARVKTYGYNKENVNSLVSSLSARTTIDKKKKDNKNDYIKLYEVHGVMPKSLLTGSDTDEDEYVQQMHVISFVGTKKGRDTEYEDFTLFSGEEEESPYMITHLIKEDSRTLSIGAVEYLFEAQWMTNHSKKSIKDTLDISSRLIFQTADANFVGRNVLSDFESGDIFIHSLNMPLTKVDNSKVDITQWENYAVSWQNLAQQITATPDAMRGVSPTSGTPYSTTAALTAQANSLFELMTENKGLHIEDMMRQFIIPHIKSQLKHKDQVVAILDDAGVQQIDMMYIPDEAVRRYNAQTINTVLGMNPGEVPNIPQFNHTQATQDIQKQMAAQGNTRFFVPDDAGESTWEDIFSDFEWNSIRVEVTNEQYDKQAMLQVLNTVMQTIASNPMILNNPNAMQLFSAIMRETGAVSPIQLTSNGVLPPLPQTRVDIRDTVDFKDLPPDAQQELLARQGIQTQPQQPSPEGPPSAGGLSK